MLHRLSLSTGLRLTGSGGAGGGGTPAYQQLVELATEDGWDGLIDPTNPDTRTLRDDGSDQYFSEIAQGVGSLPAVTQSTASAQPKLQVGKWNQLDGAQYAGDNSGQEMTSTPFTSISQPYYMIVLAELDQLTNDFAYIFLDSSSARPAIWKVLGTSDPATRADAGTALLSSTGWSAGTPLIIEVLFNGANGEITINGTLDATGDIGTDGIGGLGLSHASSPREWFGPIGPWAFFEGNPSSAIRERMRNKFSELSGVAVA